MSKPDIPIRGVINKLTQRIAALVLENAMLQAELEELIARTQSPAEEGSAQ